VSFARPKPRLIHVQDRRLTKNDGSFDYVLQLSNISWPVIVPQHFKCQSIDSGYLLACLFRIALHQILGEERDIFDSFSQGRNVYRKHVQTIIEVLSEVAFAHVGGKIAIGRCEDTHIDLDWFRASDSFELTLLKYAEQSNLRFYRQVADLVEK